MELTYPPPPVESHPAGAHYLVHGHVKACEFLVIIAPEEEGELDVPETAFP
jgi:hypothetical protein